MNRVNETNNFIIFLRVQPLKRPLQLNIMAFCPEHPKRDQNMKLTPLSETTSIPAPSIWVSPPPPGDECSHSESHCDCSARRDPGKKWRIKKKSAQNVLKRKFYRCLIASWVYTWTNPWSGSFVFPAHKIKLSSRHLKLVTMVFKSFPSTLCNVVLFTMVDFHCSVGPHILRA